MQHMRLFAALSLPANLQKKLHANFRALRLDAAQLKIVQPDHLHLTLKFLGEVPVEKLAEVVASLESAIVPHAVNEIAINAWRLLPSHRPRTIVAHVQADATLHTLAESISDRLAEAELVSRDVRRFMPHVTIARLRQPGSLSADEAAAVSNCFVDEAWTPHEVTLFESVLTKKGPDYTALQTFPLA